MVNTIRLENGESIKIINLGEIMAGRDSSEVILSNENFTAIDIYGEKHFLNWSMVGGVNLFT